MPQTLEIDGERLYKDLQDHFGTAHSILPRFSKMNWSKIILAELEAHYLNQDWDAIIGMAIDEGFDLDQYVIN